MARIFLNLRFRAGPAGLAIDPEGDELADGISPRDHALTVAGDLVKFARLTSIRDWYACSFEVTDAVGRPVATVSFSELVPE